MANNDKTVSLDDLWTIRWGVKTGTPVSLNTAMSLLNRVIDGQVTIPDTAPVPEIPSPTAKNKVAIVVGHNSRATGACALNPINMCEFAYNNLVADYMVANPPEGVVYKKFNRVYSSAGYSSEIRKVYDDVNDWNPVFVVELHFNGSSGAASYTTVLHAASSNVSKDCAKIFKDILVDELGFKDGGLMAVTRSGRGGASLYAAKAPSILTEPFFGDNVSNVTKMAEVGTDGLAKIYNKGVTSVLSKF